MVASVLSSNLGFPRMGENRELKKLVESHWAGDVSQADLFTGAKNIRASHWKLQQSQGISHIPSNDFSFYDHVLDHIHLFGVVPPRYEPVATQEAAAAVSTATATANLGTKAYFAMARGLQLLDKGIDVGSMEMKKWFDTNYHYIVPEFVPGQTFRLSTFSPDGLPKPVSEYLEAKALGIETRPVILGPLSFLLLGKSGDSARPFTSAADALTFLDALLPVYRQLFSQLREAGVQWIQIDEPVLCLDLSPLEVIAPAYHRAYAALRESAPGVKFLLATYFGELRENFQGIVTVLPIDALHIDATRSTPAQVTTVIETLPATFSLSLGVIDGRNIWKVDLRKVLPVVRLAAAKLGPSRVLVAPSCSLLHSPHSLAHEAGKITPDILDWLAFATEKLAEVGFLAEAASHPELDLESGAPLSPEFQELRLFYSNNQLSNERRRTSARIHVPAVKSRLAAVTPEMLKRQSPFASRRVSQRKRLTTLPALFPTHTIGSFPQTKEVRAARNAFRNNKSTQAEYDAFLRDEIRVCVKMQEDCGLDVLVHGEFERTDMVEYFGENLEGYVFTANGWVQSYGSRCVKPPVIFGDVSRPKPMTVDTTVFAQSLTKKPMKGMLTGPVTILQWSFVRDDQPRRDTCFQIALAIRDEVTDLEKAGIACIQIDEPAIREGLPLRHVDWDGYLQWAVDSFLLSSTGVADDTQMHSHMCYSGEFFLLLFFFSSFSFFLFSSSSHFFPLSFSFILFHSSICVRFQRHL